MAKGNPPIDLRKVVVDTGPLFNALALVFVRNSPTHRYSGFENIFGAAEYLKHDPIAERKLLELFNRIQKILITSHVIAELTRLRNVSKLPSREFWLSSVDYLARKKMDERLLGLIEIYGSDEGCESVNQIGPTDAGLIELARREKCILLTDDDKTLARRARVVGLVDQCKLVRYLL